MEHQNWCSKHQTIGVQCFMKLDNINSPINTISPSQQVFAKKLTSFHFLKKGSCKKETIYVFHTLGKLNCKKLNV